MSLPSPTITGSRETWHGPALALLIGVAAFLLCVGWVTLLPTNIAWLNTGDRAMHQLGWMFFRRSDWGIPPGISPDLGIELANSIGLVDGLALFAFPLKLIEAWLTEPFQFWGYWLLLSFALQALFGYLIARAFCAGAVLALFAAAFVVVTPAFLFRVPMHLALSGHWLVLMAIWFYVRPVSVRPWAWALLIVATTLVHIYLLAMVMSVWIAALVRRRLAGETRGRRLWGEVVLVWALMLATLWAAGFMMTSSLGSGGYGAYKFNLLGFVIPYEWSEWFPQIPHTDLDYEGLSFLGLGVMGLLVIGLLSGGILALRQLFTRRWLPLVVLLAGLVLFAVSHKIAFADREILQLRYPGIVLNLGGLFRSTGRFIWPLLYVLTILAVVMTGWRWPRAAIAVAAVAFGLQLYDSREAVFGFRERQPEPAPVWTTPLVSPFWERAAQAGYNRVRAIPYRGIGGDWKALSYYAVTHGMDTDAVYLGRVDSEARKARERNVDRAFAQGIVEPRTIYAVDPARALQMAPHLAADDLLAVIDDRIVFAKAGAALVEGLGIAPQGAITGTD